MRRIRGSSAFPAADYQIDRNPQFVGPVVRKLSRPCMRFRHATRPACGESIETAIAVLTKQPNTAAHAGRRVTAHRRAASRRPASGAQLGKARLGDWQRAATRASSRRSPSASRRSRHEDPGHRSNAVAPPRLTSGLPQSERHGVAPWPSLSCRLSTHSSPTCDCFMIPHFSSPPPDGKSSIPAKSHLT